MKRLLSVAVIGVSLLMTQVSQAAEVKAFVTGAAKRVFTTLAPQFEAAGHKVNAEFDLPPSLMKRVEAGEPYDVIILSYDVKPLIDRGLLAREYDGPRHVYFPAVKPEDARRSALKHVTPLCSDVHVNPPRCHTSP